ncbi:SDR family oxidoreductase [Pseudonocardia sp. GCM10023141]|uniref:SDR family oxidoreductase n=1 Tax=Pseudonocardia sp. GCM10023141 TaxID=3252653 RepID=UPI00361A865F
MMVLVTGGRGTVAAAVVRGLVDAGVPVRVGGREPGELTAPEGVDVVLADLTRPETLPAALEGVDRVFLYAEPAGISGFVEAATAAGVQQVVLLSSIAVHGEGAIAQRHLLVEQALSAATFGSTFLRPGGFAGNALKSWLGPISAGDTVRLAIPGSTDAPIDERDIAAVAVAILLAGPGGGYDGVALDLTGPASMTRREMVETLAAELGREARIVGLDAEEARADMAAMWPAPLVESFLSFWCATDGVPTPVSDAVERVTGRAARTFAVWAREVAATATPVAASW